MKTVTIEQPANTISNNMVLTETPVFVYNGDNILIGMLIKETHKGWIIRLGGTTGLSPHKDTREAAIKQGRAIYGYTFKVV